jgi:hypothetical protein
MWRETFQAVLNDATLGANWGASVDSQVVKKDVARYLNKYLSKGAGLDSESIRLRRSPTERRWQLWGTSQCLRRAIRHATIPIGDDFAEIIFEAMRGTSYAGALRLSSVYEVPVTMPDGREVIIGWSGYCNFKFQPDGSFHFVE